MELLNYLNLWESRLLDVREWTRQRVAVRGFEFIRLWSNLDEYGEEWVGWRLCLHEMQAFETWLPMHNHPWPFITHVLTGGYEMRLGIASSYDSSAEDRYSLDNPPETAANIRFDAESRYEILTPDMWHSLRPDVPTTTVMLQSPPGLPIPPMSTFPVRSRFTVLEDVCDIFRRHENRT